MIVSNQQADTLYYKQYPCYSVTTHLSEHRQLEFANVTYIQFSNRTSPKSQLPKYLIDKYQSPHRMYWLEWRMEEVPQAVIEEGKLRVDNLRGQSNSFEHNPSEMYRCLYIAELGKMAHIKLVFNSEPEIVAICQDFLYTIGANQLIVTELWPQSVSSAKNIESSQEFPPKQSQIIHDLQHGSKILSLDFVYDEAEGAISKVIYFHEKKGIYSQTYRRKQTSQTSLITKLLDFSLKFKKNEPQPLFYKTLVPNILGIVIHNPTQFSLFNLTEMKLIEKTRTTLEGWELSPHQPIIVKSTVNEPLDSFNDCLNIVIGQGQNIEIFLYHISYSEKAIITCPKQRVKKPASEFQNYPIHMFTSGEIIDFQKSKFTHFTAIHLEKITYLENFVLNKLGIIYLGYQKDSLGYENLSEQIPITGFVYYLKPYITHEILMQENKIWKEYKFDILRESTEERIRANSQTLERLLVPGRYEKWFIQKTLNLQKISDLQNYLQTTQQSLPQIHQHLVFEWRNQYKFVQFVIYKSQILVIRKNSIGTLIPIEEEQFLQERDSLAEQQISYNELLSRGFSVHYDIEGDQYIDEQFGMYRYKNGHENQQNGKKGSMMILTGKSYEDKLRSIHAMLQNVGDEKFSKPGRIMNNVPYYDEQQIQKLSQKYSQTKKVIIYLATQHDVQKIPSHQLKFTEESMSSFIYQIEPENPQQNYIQLHISILSLRVKDILSDYLTTLKVNYPSFSYHLTAQKNRQRPLTAQQIKFLHLEHMYFVFVIEWILNVGTKYHLQEQYEHFDWDLIEEFVHDYIRKFYSRTENTQRKISQEIIRKFFKEDLQFHVENVLAHIFRGLLKDILPHSANLKMDNFLLNNVLDVEELSEQDLSKLQIEKLNRNSNSFLLMLLKRNESIHRQSKFISDDLLRVLLNPIIFKPFSPDIDKLIPINKTFVYCVLNMSIEKEEKKRILASHMDKNEFLALILLIQLENNCYLSIDEGLEIEIYQSNLEDFEHNTIRLSKENCCIIQDLILTNYKLFLFTNQQPKDILVTESIKSEISSPQFEQQVVVYNQNQCIKFIKNLFSNIQFRYLTSVLMHDHKTSNPQSSMLLEGLSVYENKGIAQTYRQLIDEVEAINYTYGYGRGSKIDRTFKKFYSKVYKQKLSKQKLNRLSRNSKEAIYPSSGTYPQMTGLGFKLSRWQLQIIDRLYQKHIKLLRMQKKETFQSTSIIQQRMNLEYAMIRIHLFRIKLILEELPTLVEQERQLYVQIMNDCVTKLYASLEFFRDWRAKLGDQESFEVTDEQVLEALKQVYHMENSRVWDKNCDQLYSYRTFSHADQQNWQILGIPITLKWLKLFQLTFRDSLNGPSFSVNQEFFTNYSRIQDVQMKILTVIKSEGLREEEKILRDLFGEDQIQSVISRNKQLREMYENGSQQRRYFSQTIPNGYDRNSGLLSRGTLNKNSIRI